MRHVVSQSSPPLPCENLKPEFEDWEAQRAALERQLDLTREGEDDEERERLFDRIAGLERQIIETPSSELCAMRVKSQVLTWLMEQEQADGLPAMRHIRAFLQRLS